VLKTGKHANDINDTLHDGVRILYSEIVYNVWMCSVDHTWVLFFVVRSLEAEFSCTRKLAASEYLSGVGLTALFLCGVFCGSSVHLSHCSSLHLSK